MLGLFGATLFYGDSVITPAISVMGAIEGLEVVTPTLKPYVLPISTAILVGLFLVQRFGTAAVGQVVGQMNQRRRCRDIMYDLQVEWADAMASMATLTGE